MNLDILISGVGGRVLYWHRALADGHGTGSGRAPRSNRHGQREARWSAMSDRCGYTAIIPDRRLISWGWSLPKQPGHLTNKAGRNCLTGTTTIVPATVSGRVHLRPEASQITLKNRPARCFLDLEELSAGRPCQDRQRGHPGRPFDSPGAAFRFGPNAPGDPALCPRTIFGIKPARL